MNEIVSTIAYRRLRAPRADGEALLEPAIADEVAFLQQNIALREQNDCDLRGLPLGGLRTLARQELLSRAKQYTQAYRDVVTDSPDPHAPVILLGHQPELVHPGVWFKNFLLSELAHRTSSYAINLLIDNDSVRNTTVRVPGGSVDDPVVSSIALDAIGPVVPYEVRAIHDADLFDSFGKRAGRAIEPLVQRPLLGRFWPRAIEAARRVGNLGQAVAQARHELEGQWGLESLELPLSSMCDTPPFWWFAAVLLGDAARLRQVHNGCVAEYRRVNRVRSHTHPVPDLAVAQRATEVPFWLWTEDRPQRRPAFVERRGAQVLLSDQQGTTVTLDLGPDDDANRAVNQLAQARQDGIRLRPRALITTMFARLVLSDIFIHGIGGAKYDQVTDAIIRRFFAVEPPEYVVATATLKLPVKRPSVEPQDVRRTKQRLRELRYHPELHVDATPETAPLIAEKRRWIESPPPAHRLHERHAAICRVNESLHAFLGSRHQQLLDELAQLRLLMRKQAILGSREYPFCLFPSQTLREQLLDLSRQ
jgi:hypothetical protein